MTRSIVILATAPGESVSRLAHSDRAAVAMGLRPLSSHAMAYCPFHDWNAQNYARAAGMSRVAWLPTLSSLNFEVALVGLGALENFGDALVGELAELYNATLALDVLDIQPDGLRWRVLKDAGQGDREEWIVAGPVVLVISELAVRPPYVSHYKRKMAADETHERPHFDQGTPRLTVPDRGAWEPTRPRVKLGRRATYLDRSAECRLDLAFGAVDRASDAARDHIIQADAMTCGEYLLRYLAHHGFIDRQEVGAVTSNSLSRIPSNDVGKGETSGELHVPAPADCRFMPAPMPAGKLASQLDRLPRPHATSERAAPITSEMSSTVFRRPRLAQDEGRRRVRGPRAIE